MKNRIGYVRVLLAVLSGLLLPAGLLVGAAALREDNIKIASSPTTNRVDIQLDANVVVRVVDGIATNDYFFVDIYGTAASFPDKKFLVKDGILKAVQTVSYSDLKVLRVIFFPFNKTIFQVVDSASGFVFPTSPATAKTFAPCSRTTRHLVVNTSKYRHYPLPSVIPEPSALPSRQAGYRALSAGKRRVIIDPGHGGSDPGARSPFRVNGRIAEEKDIVLAIAVEVERLLRQLPNVTPILTRERDIYMSLTDRVSFAEKLEGDLFVSIHANATLHHINSPSVRGLEVYYLQEKSNPALKYLEAAENLDASPELDGKSADQWLLIARNLTRDILDVQRSFGAEVCEEINTVFMADPYYAQFSRGVRSAKYRVLMNRVMPAVLIEVGYMDVRPEFARLVDPAFQKRIAILITNGILRYFAKNDPQFAYFQYAAK